MNPCQCFTFGIAVPLHQPRKLRHRIDVHQPRFVNVRIVFYLIKVKYDSYVDETWLVPI